MRVACLSCLASFLSGICLSAEAQTPGMEIEAGLGYARIFDGGGFSVSGVLDKPIGSGLEPIQQAVGFGLWYAQTKVASAQADLRHRNIFGTGVRYRVATQRCCGPVHPFLAVPLELLRSSIEEFTHPAAALTSHAVPQPPPAQAIEDAPGGAWGWGTGLEFGVELSVARNLSCQTRVQGLYQDIYAGAATNTAWSWHAGLRYGF
jgi:hypothetical protein